MVYTQLHNPSDTHTWDEYLLHTYHSPYHLGVFEVERRGRKCSIFIYEAQKSRDQNYFVDSDGTLCCYAWLRVSSASVVHTLLMIMHFRWRFQCSKHHRYNTRWQSDVWNTTIFDNWRRQCRWGRAELCNTGRDRSRRSRWCQLFPDFSGRDSVPWETWSHWNQNNRQRP